MLRLVTAVRLSSYGAAYFFAAGAFMSYWPVWLRDRGVERRRDRHPVHEPPDRERRVDARDRLAGASPRRHARPHPGAGERRHPAGDRLPVLPRLPRHPPGQPGVGRGVGADHGALRRRAGDRDQGARLQLRQPSRLELGGLHPGRRDLRRGRRPQRAVLGALCRFRGHRAARASRAAAAAGRIAPSRRGASMRRSASATC